MGAWGDEPWESDAAADWFAKLFVKSRLAERITKGLDADDPDVVRSAAHLVALLGRPHVWPSARLDTDVAHARRCLEQLAPKTERRGELPLLFTADLATAAERAKPPGSWSVMPPAVTRLAAVGPRRWAAGSYRHLKLFDDRGKVVADLSPAKPRGTYGGETHLFATESGIFVSAEADETTVHTSKNGEVVHRWSWRKADFAANTAVARDGSQAVVLTRNGVLHLLDLRTGEVVHRMKHPQPHGADGWCAIGPRTAVSTWGEAVRIWDLRTGKQLASLTHKHRALEMTPDGAHVLTYTEKGFAIWNVATKKKVVLRSTVENTPDPELVLQAGVLRPRKSGDLPYFERAWRNEAWLDERHVVKTYEPLDDETEVVIARLDEVEKRRAIARGTIAVRTCRLATTHDRKVILVSDRCARIYGFGVPAKAR